ncbi:hypothetical protein V8D89_012034 [Ganoderma adspersum]
MNPKFRDATEDDLPAILEIYNDQILNGTATFHTEPEILAERVQWLAELKARQYPCLIAELSDAETGTMRTVAWANLRHYHDRPAYAATTELSLYVHKDFQGRGIGEGLLASLLEETRKQGERFHVIIASVTSENEGTMRFWAKHGFELRGTIKEVGRKFGRWLDVSYFQLIL